MTQPQEEPGGGIQFGTFNYTDRTGGINSIQIQYEVGGRWLPSSPSPIAVSNGGASDRPGYQDVTCTKLSVDGGANYIPGNAIAAGVKSATGNTDANGATVVSDS